MIPLPEISEPVFASSAPKAPSTAVANAQPLRPGLGEDTLRVVIQNTKPTGARRLNYSDPYSVTPTALPISDWQSLRTTSNALRQEVDNSAAYGKDKSEFDDALKTLGDRRSVGLRSDTQFGLLMSQLPRENGPIGTRIIKTLAAPGEVNRESSIQPDAALRHIATMHKSARTELVQRLTSRSHSPDVFLGELKPVVSKLTPAEATKFAEHITSRGLSFEAWNRAFDRMTPESAAATARMLGNARPPLRSALIRDLTINPHEAVRADKVRSLFEQYRPDLITQADRRNFEDSAHREQWRRHALHYEDL